MGEDKSLLPFDTYTTLIEYQYKKFSKIFKKVYISTKENKFNFKTNLIFDSVSDVSSPMIALQSIFSYLDEEKVFIISVDTPLVLDITIDELINKSANYTVNIAQDTTKTHNLCGVYDIAIKPLIDDLIKKDIHKINYL
ncbi:MAG: molybdenum cofactor guanylyltransferase, partial [Epsilonproteobacteria bacterium]